MKLFTTSAPGTGDELRLALCLPRAGPGLSHGGQMTAEAKWVLCCSPREPLHSPPFQSSQASEKERVEMIQGSGHHWLLLWSEDIREVHTAPYFSSQARSPACPS